jgi:hypothetical protein
MYFLDYFILANGIKDVYRGKHKNYGLMWNLVAGLVNFKASTKHLRYAS